MRLERNIFIATKEKSGHVHAVPATPPEVKVRHHTHADIVKRLRRAEGHLRSIVEMIERDRACVDVAQQLYAVEKAISQAKKTFIHDHLDDCLEQSIGARSDNQRDAIEEFKEITKYL